jgi:redox-sensitive bicupin YhaK (pirin superfamily)
MTHMATSGRRIFIYLTEGQVSANSETLKAKDQARIDIEEPLVLKAQQPSELILIDVP